MPNVYFPVMFYWASNIDSNFKSIRKNFYLQKEHKKDSGIASDSVIRNLNKSPQNKKDGSDFGNLWC